MSEDGHYEIQDPEANPTILVGVDRAIASR